MNLAGGGYHHRARNGMKLGANCEMGLPAILVIKVSDLRVLQIVAQSLFLAIVIVTLPMILPTIRAVSQVTETTELSYGWNGVSLNALPVIIRDLTDQGHLKNGDKGLVLSRGGEVDLGGGLDGSDVEVVMEDDLVGQERISNDVYDFLFASSLENGAFIDRVVKNGGIVVSALTDYHSTELFLGEFDYNIVYVRQFGSTVLGMKKVGAGKVRTSLRKTPSFRNRRLLGLTPDAKKVALKGLEDVMLEPPSQAKPTSLKNFKYLPDLLGDSLGGYDRRMFVNVGFQDEKKQSLKWFQKNYPTKNQVFKTYHLNVATDESWPQIGVSDWLMENVKENDFVVMKAEAEVVEEMIERKAMHLVDELFLECKNQWQDSDDENKNKRAYWECLALYGRLIDAGIAVHQWWDGGGDRNGRLGMVVGIFGMAGKFAGNGGKVTLGALGKVGIAGSGGKVGFGREGCAGRVGFGRVGIGGSCGRVGFGKFGIFGRFGTAGVA